ncbi:MAG: class I SAM-dependent methyltransferase [Sulfuricaulis sp.]
MARLTSQYTLNISRDAREIMEQQARQIMGAIPEIRWVENYFRYHKDRLALDFEWCIKNFSKHARILEVGAYPFFVTKALMSAGFQVQTVDAPTAAVRDLAQQLAVSSRECDIERAKLPFSDAYFDEILFNEVFEHLRIDLLFTIDELRRVLRPGGRLWLSTPNLRSAKGIVNFLLKKEAWSRAGGVTEQWNHLRTMGWMGHVREYTSKEVADFLSANGFSVERIVYRGEWSNPIANFASMLKPDLRPFFSCIAIKPS